MKVVIMIIGIAAGLLWGYNLGSLEPRVYTERYVMEEICNYSSTVVSDEWEDACGLAQSVSGKTFSKLVKE